MKILLYSNFPQYQEPEPSQLPSIPPTGGHTGRKIQSLTPQTKFQPPKCKYVTLEISEVFVSPYPFLSCNL